MVKCYESVSDEQREQLLYYVHICHYSIVRAAEMTKIYYPTAKAINRIYKKTGRIHKKNLIVKKNRD
jgi:hypothetical protein